ncbi:MAG: nucleotide exchange factor GrpE [Bacteroidia bacterium]|nr:nucleotide exchange factor GrpE [Bacteroidia bacterium]MDW8158025.1 nucleotide exchange factor GrpE [Bacteroidia bacterium]
MQEKEINQNPISEEITSTLEQEIKTVSTDSPIPDETEKQEEVACRENQAQEATATIEQEATEIRETHKESEAISQQLEKLQLEVQEWKDRYIRLASDFENYKKRILREKEQMIQFANEKLLLAFMPLIDDLIRTLKAVESTDNLESIKAGIGLVYKNFKSALEKESVLEIPSIGETFNSEYHEAIARVPATDENQKGKIIEEIEKGYIYHGKVIRFAKVIVAE